MTLLLCASAVVITLETQKCRKKAPHSVEFNLFTNCDRNGFRRMKEEGSIKKAFVASFLIFSPGLCYGLSKFSDDFTQFFRLQKTISKSLGKHLKYEARCCSQEHGEQVCQVSWRKSKRLKS